MHEKYDKPIYTSEICAFGTIATRGAIRDVGRAFDMPLKEVESVLSSLKIRPYAKSLWDKDGELLDEQNQEVIDNYPELFKYVKMLEGTITNVKPHPAGTIVSPIPISEHLGTCIAGNSKLPVSQVDKDEVEYLNFVKLDILGLKNLEIIKNACELAGIDVPHPDELDTDDPKVWENMLNNGTTGIFQWDTSSSSPYFSKLFNKETIRIAEEELGISKFGLMIIGNSAVRPVGASYRNDIAKGHVEIHGNKYIDEFLKNRFGRLIFQEDLMMFFVKFCGFTFGEADIIRRAFTSGRNTEEFLPKIEDGFVEIMTDRYNESEGVASDIIKHFKQTIIDSSGYLFNIAHSVEYSYVGFILAYLRTYYPLEFLASSFQANMDNNSETAKFISYMEEYTDYKMVAPEFGYSDSNYRIDKENGLIFKGMESIKNLNENVSSELLKLANEKEYDNFIDLLVDIIEKTSVNKTHMEVLISLDFFKKFGNSGKLQAIYTEFRSGKNKYLKTYVDKTKVKRIKALKDMLDNDEIEYKETDSRDLIKAQLEFLGYVDVIDKTFAKNVAIVTEINFNGFATFYTTIYFPNNGRDLEFAIYKEKFMSMPKELEVGDVIIVDDITKNKKTGQIVLSKFRIVMNEKENLK